MLQTQHLFVCPAQCPVALTRQFFKQFTIDDGDDTTLIGNRTMLAEQGAETGDAGSSSTQVLRYQFVR